MKPFSFPRVAGLAVMLLAAAAQSSAQAEGASDSMQVLVDGIVEDVIDRTVEAARREVRRNTGIDPLQRGYIRDRSYRPVAAGASEETRRELSQLNDEHDRTIAQLEEELHRKLDKMETEFQREAAKEDKPEKLAEKREKLQEQADDAYAIFDEKIAAENVRFDKKREQILSKERRG